jgi:hypothetical protein
LWQISCHARRQQSASHDCVEEVVHEVTSINGMGRMAVYKRLLKGPS